MILTCVVFWFGLCLLLMFGSFVCVFGTVRVIGGFNVG